MIVDYNEAALAVLQDDETAAAALAQKPSFRDCCEVADLFAKQYCNRQFEFATYTEELHGLGSNYVMLTEWPVKLIRALYVDFFGKFAADTLVDDGTFHVEDRRKLIYENSLLPAPNPYWNSGWASPVNNIAKVIYDAGYVAPTDVDPAHTGIPKMPGDLRMAVKRIIATDWRRGINGELMASESFDGYSYRRGSRGSALNPSAVDPYDERVYAILDQYKTIL